MRFVRAKCLSREWRNFVSERNSTVGRCGAQNLGDFVAFIFWSFDFEDTAGKCINSGKARTLLSDAKPSCAREILGEKIVLAI
jgi:hypothetical protein